MKASELMINDWVNLSKGNWSENRQVGLTDIEMIAESVYLAEPIPITPEILEKNGWEESKEYEPFIYYSLKGKDYSISLSKEWDSTTETLYWSLSIGNHGTDATLSIDFIHQLQQALRLCGVEKEITI